MTRRTQSSRRGLPEHFSDPCVRRARAERWRSRAVLKQGEADKKERLLRRGPGVLDPGAVPGVRSQYVRSKVGSRGKSIASDIFPMDALAGVEFAQGDFRAAAVFEQPLAPEMAGQVLKPGGGALIKVFRGAGFRKLTAVARLLKPAASRARSPGICLLASGLRLV
jgi:23S rRNA (uridine2552-2'-O)-methyltransferase